MDRLDVGLAGAEKATLAIKSRLPPLTGPPMSMPALPPGTHSLSIQPLLNGVAGDTRLLKMRLLNSFGSAGSSLFAFSPQINFDVGWRAAGRFFVAEVKSCTNANVEKQLRLGLGQVLRYRSVLEEALDCSVVAVLALEADLADTSWHKLCDTLGVHLVVAPRFECQSASKRDPGSACKRNPLGASFCSVQGCHPSVPAHACDELARGAAVKNGRSFSGRPQGLFLRAVSTAAY